MGLQTMYSFTSIFLAQHNVYKSFMLLPVLTMNECEMTILAQIFLWTWGFIWGRKLQWNYQILRRGIFNFIRNTFAFPPARRRRWLSPVFLSGCYGRVGCCPQQRSVPSRRRKLHHIYQILYGQKSIESKR